MGRVEGAWQAGTDAHMQGADLIIGSAQMQSPSLASQQNTE